MAGQFTIYRSTDASAPTLSGTAGDLTTLLDACLVNGYGAKANAGWTIAYTATNRRAYHNGTGSSQLYFRVRDDAGGTGGAKEAQLRGFETMSDVNTGTNGFANTNQVTLTDNSLIIRKSSTADATVHPWIVAADNKTCYIFIQTGDQTNTYYAAGFGDIYSVVSGDAWNGAIWGRSAENSATAGSSDLDSIQSSIAANLNGGTGIYLARNYTGAAGSAMYNRASTWSQTVNGNSGGALIYPNPADNGIFLSRVFLGWNTNASGTVHVRGYMRGYWAWMHVLGVNDGDTFNGSGDLAGKTFLIIKFGPNQGLFVLETSNTLP
jgi:hypothetical protein